MQMHVKKGGGQMNDYNPYIELGSLLAHARNQKHLTLKELSTQTGISDTYINAIEKGRQRGSYETLRKLALALDLPPESVLQKAGFANTGFVSFDDLNFDLETHAFASLPPKVKKLLLKLVPLINEILEFKD